ncbi:MAG: MerR family transcriptional regulator [Myxococcota bacterium]
MTTKPNPKKAETAPASNPAEAAADESVPAALDAAAALRPAAEAIRHFKTSEVVDLLDLSRRQLQYWAKTRLVEPSARTPGGHHRYDFNDLVALKATKRLIDAGVSVQKIRKSVGALRKLLPQVGRPLSELVLVATGDVVLVFHDETVFEAITGQEWVFPVAAFEREVSDFRHRQEAREEARHEAVARARSGADGETGTGRRAGAGRRAARRAPVEPVTPSDRESASGSEATGQRAARPAKPSVRSAGQSRKRWSRTG